MKCPLFRAVLALLPRPPLALTPRCAWAGRWCLSHIGDSLVAVTKPKLCDEPAGNAHRVGAVGVLSAGHAVSETQGMSPLGGHPTLHSSPNRNQTSADRHTSTSDRAAHQPVAPNEIYRVRIRQTRCLVAAGR